MSSPCRSLSLESMASSALSTSDEDFKPDSRMLLDPIAHVKCPTMSDSKRVDDHRKHVQIDMAIDEWTKYQAWKKQRDELPTTGSAPKAIETHAHFFLPAENIFFLVESTLYSVPRAPFDRHSSAFTGKGLTKVEPLVLEDVKVAHFDHFLSILHPFEYGVYTASTVEDWASILHLAERWGFESIKMLAIKHLATIASDIDKVVLGRQYGIDQWLQEGLMDAYLREKSLTKEEGRRMKVEDFVEISAIRQMFPPTPQATQVLPPSLEEEYARYAPLYPGSLRNGSESTAPEAFLVEGTNVSHPGPCEGQNALALDPASNPALSMLMRIDGSVKEESGSEAKIKEAELQRADRAKQRDETRRALEAYFESPSVGCGDWYQREAKKKILLETTQKELLDFIASYNAERVESP